MTSFFPKKLPAGKWPRHIGNADVPSSAQHLKSRLISCLPIIARRCQPRRSPPPQQQQATDDLLPIHSQAQYKGLEKCSHFRCNPFYTEHSVTEDKQHPGHHVPEKQPSILPDEPLLMPKPLQTQAEKLREAEKAVKLQAQQLQNHKQRHAEALSKLSEQHGNAIKEVQVQSEHRLSKQQTAHESVVAGIHAQHIRDVRQIVRKHTIVHNQAMDAAQAKFDLERTDQQSLHEQTLKMVCKER